MPVSTAVDPSAVARVVGIATEFKDFRTGGGARLPQRLAVFGQGATLSTYPVTKQSITSALQAGQIYGFGSPLHLSARQIFPVNGDGAGTIPVTFYPMVDNPGASVASVNTLTPVGTQTAAAEYRVSVGGESTAKFVIAASETIANICTIIADAVNAQLNSPVVAVAGATEVVMTAKWKGVSSNGFSVVVEGDSLGVAYGNVQTVAGLLNPTVDAALALVGDVWETIVINLLELTDTTALEAFKVWGEGRWGALTRKPALVFTGTTEDDLDTVTTTSEARNLDRINIAVPFPDSAELPFVLTSRAITRVAVRANNTPPRDYGSLRLDGLLPGADGVQWNYAQRDLAVKRGTSTTEVKNGLINVSDLVTMYHPDGDENPAYRYVVDIVKLSNVLFNLDLIFASEEWDGAPLIPDDQPTVEPTAKQPKMAVAAAASMVDNLALAAILSDPVTTKKGIVAEIDEFNPKRLNLCVPVKLSGNTNINSVDLKFGFFFG